MTWKIERWYSEVFPGEENIFSTYKNLTARELVVVSVAVLDLALVELIEQRLIDNPKEVELFLGANGDGRAPIATFGARIQLAYLTGIITIQDVKILRIIKQMRNLFAHRVNIDFLSPEVVKESKKLLNEWAILLDILSKAGTFKKDEEAIEELKTNVGVISEAGEGLLLAVFGTYQAYFDLHHGKIPRLEIT